MSHLFSQKPYISRFSDFDAAGAIKNGVNRWNKWAVALSRTFTSNFWSGSARSSGRANWKQLNLQNPVVTVSIWITWIMQDDSSPLFRRCVTKLIAAIIWLKLVATDLLYCLHFSVLALRSCILRRFCNNRTHSLASPKCNRVKWIASETSLCTYDCALSQRDTLCLKEILDPVTCLDHTAFCYL